MYKNGLSGIPFFYTPVNQGYLHLTAPGHDVKPHESFTPAMEVS
jgi:hypothetical protein